MAFARVVLPPNYGPCGSLTRTGFRRGLPMANPKPPKFADVSSEYWKLFLECRVNADKLGEVQRIATSITLNRARYQTVTTGLGAMPWWFVALIHSLEGGLSFTTHLHNGDPLTARTKHVPAGRPV